MFKQGLISLFSISCILYILLSSSTSLAKKTPPLAEPVPLPAPVGSTQLVSKSSDGIEGNSNSHNQGMTPDGRFLVFSSLASNLVPNDTNNKTDIFVHDRLTEITERISVVSDGTQADNSSHGADISDDGRYVTFYSTANNLVPGEQVHFSQIYLHDRLNGQTERVSVAADGGLENGSSSHPAINADGRYIVYSSNANNLIVNDSSDTFSDVFLYDRLNHVTEKISVASDGSSGDRFSNIASITDDGQIVAFSSFASNFSNDDTNNGRDIFLHHRASRITERVHISYDGVQANESSGSRISGDGRFILFSSTATNLVIGDTNNYRDVFVHDRLSATTERVNLSYNGSQANDDSFGRNISAGGRYVTYMSYANNLSPEDHFLNWWSDVFIFDRDTKTTELISVSSAGEIGNYDSARPTVSSNGRFVSFHSAASNLTSDDNGLGRIDIFIRDRNP
ncbi:MAG: TolB family protein [Gammaproteobacteria bacterium]